MDEREKRKVIYDRATEDVIDGVDAEMIFSATKKGQIGEAISKRSNEGYMQVVDRLEKADEIVVVVENIGAVRP